MRVHLDDSTFLDGECGEGLVYVVDLFYKEVDRFRKLVRDGGDHNVAVMIKVSEGEEPRTSRDERLMRRTREGAAEIVLLARERGWDWGVYHYATPGHDGPRNHWDARHELDHHAAQVGWLHSEVGDEGHTLATWLDVEDGNTPLDGAELEGWIEHWAALHTRRVGHDPVLYSYTHYLDSRLPDGHGLGGGLRLLDARYHNNNPNRTLDVPEVPKGWARRAGWQFTSRYRGGLDRNVVRLSAIQKGSA